VPSEAALQELPAAIPGDVVDDLVLAVREAATNAILYGSCDAQPVKMTVRVQGGWIEATIRDRAAPIPRGSRDEPSRAWAVADRAVGRRGACQPF
jgi:anti-sigma regulatory factor (Ser/Thr protein kinase)